LQILRNYYLYVCERPCTTSFSCKICGTQSFINIDTGEQIEGNLPRRALRLVQDWTELHREELNKNWIESQKDNPEIIKIEPLK